MDLAIALERGIQNQLVNGDIPLHGEPVEELEGPEYTIEARPVTRSVTGVYAKTRKGTRRFSILVLEEPS